MRLRRVDSIMAVANSPERQRERVVFSEDEWAERLMNRVQRSLKAYHPRDTLASAYKPDSMPCITYL